MQGAAGIAYAYLGCFYQGSSKILSNYQQNYPTSINNQCSVVCNAQGYNFFGTVFLGGLVVAAGECYCGNALNYVAVLNLGIGPAPDNNCPPCPGSGLAPLGACGFATMSTVAIYARAF